MTTVEIVSVCVTVIASVIGVAVVVVNGNGKKEVLDKLSARVERLELQREEFVRLETKVDSIQTTVYELKTMIGRNKS